MTEAGRCALCARDAGGYALCCSVYRRLRRLSSVAGGDALYAALYTEAVEGGLCLPEVMRCVLLYMLEAVEGGLCLPEVLEVLEVMRCVPLCILEAVESEISLLEVQEVLEVPEGIRCVLLYIPEAV